MERLDIRVIRGNKGKSQGRVLGLGRLETFELRSLDGEGSLIPVSVDLKGNQDGFPFGITASNRRAVFSYRRRKVNSLTDGLTRVDGNWGEPRDNRLRSL